MAGNTIDVDEIFISADPLEPFGGNDFAGNVIFGNTRGAPNNVHFYNIIVANAETFSLAWDLFNEGEYNDCISQCYQYLSEEIDGRHAGQSIELINACLKRTNGDFGDFRDYCLDLAEEEAGTVAGRAARWMAIECLVADDAVYAALVEYEAIAADEENPDDAIVANIRVLYLEARTNVQNVNAAGSMLSRRTKLLNESNRRRQEQRLADASIPLVPTLQTAYPNPFNSSIVFNYSLPEAMNIELSLFDLQGRQVTNLFEGMQLSGNHRIALNAIDLPVGAYMIRLKTTGGYQTSQMVTLLK